MKWFDRTFSFDMPSSLFPNVIERLRGTPARLEERLTAVSPGWLVTRPPDRSWSIQENAGHLLDLEQLWRARFEDFVSGRPSLRPADLSNRRTHEAEHHSRPLAGILQDFRKARAALVALAEPMDEEMAARQATHPRLAQPMRLIDHLWFVAEHDDHHLARITALHRKMAAQSGSG